MRKHLEDIAKLPAQTVNVSLSNPETQQYNLETRLCQLDYAIQMELWQVSKNLFKLLIICFNYNARLFIIKYNY